MRNTLRTLLAIIAFTIIAPATFAQSGTEGSQGIVSRTIDERLIIARGLTEYPVTVGDQYRVYFQRGGATSQIDFSIPGTYMVNLGPIGSFSAEGMTIDTLYQRVERLISAAYPSSYPRAELLSVGVFRVRITGQIPRVRIRQAWGLTRLSELVAESDSPEASIRRVVVVSAEGRRNTYDLFRAQRGDESQDPYVRPGDRIELQPRLRSVSIRGEVRFPGTYEILGTEDLRTLIESYAGGLTDLANRERIELRRIADDGVARTIDYRDVSQRATPLEDRDTVVVRSTVETFPIVYIEGAVLQEPLQNIQGEGTDPTAPPPARSQVVRRTLLQGETLLDLLRSVESQLHPDANLREGLIRRPDTTEDVAVNMEALLYGRQRDLDRVLKPYDRVIIPFGIFEVFVTGEVTNSGFEEVRSLERLSQVVEPYFTEFSSNRDVVVRSANGDEMVYDLFRAQRFGERNENPFLQPGDTIEVQRRGRQVQISGQVERPGTYQLLPDEQLDTLIESYAGGLTDLANRERIELRRIADDGVARTIDYRDVSQRVTPLEDRDTVVVRSTVETFPIVYIEGAILQEPLQNIQGEGTDPTAPPPARSQVVRRTLLQGETLLDLLRSVESQLHPDANLREGLIRRPDTTEDVAINMEALLYGRQRDLDRVLQPYDRIIIPFGIFEVFVTGEVTNSGFEEVRSLERLSQVVEPYFTEFSSNRDVVVRSANGDEMVYDLFRAQRFGERDENPFLQPGDTIEVQRRGREVQISGQVERPGTYQLLPDEQLDTLIESYAGGLTKVADPTRVSIVSINENGDSGSSSQHDHDITSQPARTIVLSDMDRVSVPSRSDFLPAVFFEGAIRATGTDDGGDGAADADRADQYRHQFTPGETVADAVRALRNRFLTTADLQNAFIQRDDTRIPVNIASMLYSDRIPPSPELQRNDRIVIPFRQYFVSVSGAVANPGQYPYIPDRGYRYYLGLAGGTDPQRHIGENPRIRDFEGNRKPDRAVIEPEDDIFFASTNPIYHLSPILAVASTILSSIAIIVSIGGF